MKLVRRTWGGGTRGKAHRSGAAPPWLEDPVRARVRRRIRVGGAAAVTALVLVPLHLLSVATAQELGERAWASGNPVAAERWFARADRIDLVERWRALYDRGVAVYGRGGWLEAAALFARAQSTVPEEHLCRVVLNRSLALETLGDELDGRDDEVGARMRWSEAQQVLADARGCSAEDGDREQDQESSFGSSSGQDQEPAEGETGDAGDGSNTDGGEGAQDEGPEGEGPEGEGAEAGDAEGQDPGEGQEGEVADGDSAEGDTQAGDGSGQEGAGSEQEQLEAANQRLQEKVNGQPKGSGDRPKEKSPEQKQAELAERGMGAARKRSSAQDGVGPVKGTTPSRPTW